MRVKLFEPCDMEYDVYDKPVRYTEEFLKELASNTTGCKLVYQKHRSEQIGDVSNLTFTDGALWGDVNTDKASDNLKYSPSYNSELVDNGDHWLATKGELLEIAMTDSPRQAILNNTADNGGSKMSDKNSNDETIEFFQKEIKRLQQENTKLEFKAKQNKEKLDNIPEMEKELEELRKWKETNSKIIEEQKPIIEKYEAQQKQAHEDLLEKASKGNPEIKEKLKDFSTEQLQTMVELDTTEQPAKGVGADNAPGINEGNPEDDEETKQKAEFEEVRAMFGELTKEE